MNLTSLKMIAN